MGKGLNKLINSSRSTYGVYFVGKVAARRMSNTCV